MEAFKAYLEDEGLPTNEIDYEKIVIKTIKSVDLDALHLSLPKNEVMMMLSVMMSFSIDQGLEPMASWVLTSHT